MMNRRHFLGTATLALATTPAAAATVLFPQSPQASAEPAPRLRQRSAQPVRVLHLHHLHTEERLEVSYRTGERYHRDALKQLNYFLRDFRTGDVAAMDPQAFDILFDLKQQLGEPEALFQIIGGYRSPRTNAMLSKTSNGVAQRSLHLTGQAIDIRIDGIPTTEVRDTALAMARGGVGYYPRSNFVHVDTGQVRSWGV